LLAGVVGAFAIGVTVEFIRIQRDLQHGQDILDNVELSYVSHEGGVEPFAARASAAFDRAAKRAEDSPFLRVLSPLPILGSQVDAVRDLTAAAAEAGRLGHEMAKRVDDGLHNAKGDPANRIALLDTVVDALNEMHTRVDGIKVGANGWLVPPLAWARDHVVRDLAR